LAQDFDFASTSPITQESTEDTKPMALAGGVLNAVTQPGNFLGRAFTALVAFAVSSVSSTAAANAELIGNHICFWVFFGTTVACSLVGTERLSALERSP
ncbi:hypothetical protein HK405_011788, partial [Cladochytrium tenue]